MIKSKAGIKLAFFTAKLLKKASDLIYKSIETPSVNKDAMVVQNEFVPFLTSDVPPAEWAEKITAAGKVQWFAWSDHTGLTGHINTPGASAGKKETDVNYTSNTVENIKDDAKAVFSEKKENRIFNKTTKTWVHPWTKKHIVSEFQPPPEIHAKQGYHLKERPPYLIEKNSNATDEFIKKTFPEGNILSKEIDKPVVNLKGPVPVKTKKTSVNNKTTPETICYNSHRPTWPINNQAQNTTRYNINSTSYLDFHIKSEKSGAIFKTNKKSGIQTKTKRPATRDKKTDTDINFRRIKNQALDIKDNQNQQKSPSDIENLQTMNAEIKTNTKIHTSASKGVWPKLPEITPPVWKYNPTINVSERITILEAEQKGRLWSV